QLSFEQADTKVFRCLGLAYEAITKGGSYPVVLNAANEILVQKFLGKEISFLDIQNGIEEVLSQHVPSYHLELSDVISIDREIRHKLGGK
ncbi:MAG: 1-deoxy-D-xylulose-5-phosphate reductoisomerase, partial [Eubacteriales bacterium]|nr:1-deoxy-D-xylulose-5-phosphate reductoisomerase [Eubacteriales bacterium]